MKHLHNELLHNSTDAEICCCFRLDARILNILIFMHDFFHQTNKIFYLQSLIFNLCLCFKCESGLRKTDRHKVRQTAFYCYCLNTASLPQIQFTFHRKTHKAKVLDL